MHAEQSLIISRHPIVFENKGCKLSVGQENTTQLQCMHQYELGLGQAIQYAPSAEILQTHSLNIE